MTVVTLEKAQADLADLLRRAEAGEEIVIARGDRPAVQLTVVRDDALPEAPRPKRTPGALAHLRGQIPDSFFDPIFTEEELRQLEEKSLFPDDVPR